MNLPLARYVDQPGDCWAALRAAWERLGDGDLLTVELGKHGATLGPADASNLLLLSGFEIVSIRRSGGVTTIEAVKRSRTPVPLSCSVIVPCRNEAGNVDTLVQRVPAMGTHTELIFVDGASTDGTPERVEQLIRLHPDRDISLLHQESAGGKAAAVFQGFDAARGDVLMILDADMTVAPEDLPRFYLALAEGVTDFANGTRFAYPMDEDAMRPLNHAGNRVFGLFFSWLLGARVTDSLCGTKAIFMRDWAAIQAARPLFGGHDPWGDFDLLLGAAYAGLRILDVPVHYHARVAGESKMRPFRHGWVLARTCLAGVYQLKLHGRAAVGSS
jgi:glycosyltransferase involved in cell wall biosynthesis